MSWPAVAVFGAITALAVVWLNERFNAVEELVERMGFQIMAQVSIDQQDLDDVGTALEDLVNVVRQIDTSKLPAADKTSLSQGLTDLTNALNEKLSPTTPVTPPSEGDV